MDLLKNVDHAINVLNVIWFALIFKIYEIKITPKFHGGVLFIVGCIHANSSQNGEPVYFLFIYFILYFYVPQSETSETMFVISLWSLWFINTVLLPVALKNDERVCDTFLFFVQYKVLNFLWNNICFQLHEKLIDITIFAKMITLHCWNTVFALCYYHVTVCLSGNH